MGLVKGARGFPAGLGLGALKRASASSGLSGGDIGSETPGEGNCALLSLLESGCTRGCLLRGSIVNHHGS